MICSPVRLRLTSFMPLLTSKHGVIRVKTKYIQYYVEGDDEKKLLDILKTDLRVIKPGKVQKLNAVEQEITDIRLRLLKEGTMVVLVFDTDTRNTNILLKNIQKLNACKSVSEDVLIPQVANLEEELVYCCNIRRIEELLGNRSRTDFKTDLIPVSNLGKKLQEHQFDINRLWSRTPSRPNHEFGNGATKIKL